MTPNERVQMARAYEPGEVESAWSQRWEEADLFKADGSSPKPHYSIALPPPNITGVLHMGHATNGTVQDVWARYRRMTGYEVLFLPGTDHAAIATQAVIERQLAQERTTKEQLGREEFDRRVDRWYAETGATIISQFRELGVSLDLSRLRFTMDPAYVRAVRTAFVRFFEKGWLYRGPRIVNWCPRNLSAISDLEVDWREHDDTLYEIRYPFSDGEGGVTIATVRPETMLGDTAVAVNANDERYRDVIGRRVILPLVGRELEIIADEAVEPGFGTGALKVTPAHDPLDYEIGERHGLEVVNVINPDGTMHIPELPAYDGVPTEEARTLVVRDLQDQGLLVASRPYTHQVGHCDRCGAVIEPLISEQWFLRMGPMAEMAVAASAAGKVRWHPGRYERTYLDWLRGLRDWCVSRQLWLGHRIPVYTCENGHTFASVDEPSRCGECGTTEIAQDPDVLDTWFSSALWPFATLGWPDDTPDLRDFFPTDMNCTGRGIINLWVSRMIMTSLEFLGEVPFHDVAIHCTVLTRDGMVMSKSRPETVVDPRDVVARYGADALRIWCASIAMSSQDVRWDESRIEGYRRFSNKLWNATRLVLGSLGVEMPATPAPGANLELADRWILSRLDTAIAAVTAGIEEYNFQASTQTLYDFAWGEYCDWYLEAVKARLADGDEAARAVALHVLDVLLRLLHPFMPFVSEELWHRLPGEREFLVRASWPQGDALFRDSSAEQQVQRLQAMVEEIRALKKSAGAPARSGELKVATEAPAAEIELIQAWAQVAVRHDLPDGGAALASAAAYLHLPVPAANVERRERELVQLRAELQRVEGKLGNAEFRSKAPAAVVQREEAKAAELKETISRLEKR